jgi:hypothetical protein
VSFSFYSLFPIKKSSCRPLIANTHIFLSIQYSVAVSFSFYSLSYLKIWCLYQIMGNSISQLVFTLSLFGSLLSSALESVKTSYNERSFLSQSYLMIYSRNFNPYCITVYHFFSPEKKIIISNRS